jgi:lysine-specific demethylase 8
MKKVGDVERVSGMTREQFFEGYFRRRPVILDGIVRHWAAVRSWSPEFFGEHHGDFPIRIDRYDPTSTRTYLQQHLDYVHREIPFREFIASLSEPAQRFTIREDMNLLYALPGALQALDYFRPFSSKEDALSDDYCGLWFSSATDVTGLHADLIEGHLFQIYGRKRFYFMAPDQTPNLYEESAEAFDDPRLAERIEAVDLDDFRNLIRWPGVNFFFPDYAKHPLLACAEYVEGDLGPGDVMYVPEGWWHATRSLTISISVTRTVDESAFLRQTEATAT